MEPEQAGLMKCDTCGKLTAKVSRVVIDTGYNRANARPMYNCPDCYEKKLANRLKDDAKVETTSSK